MSIPKRNDGLEKGSGLYWKRKTIYLVLYQDGKRYGPYCTKTDNPDEAMQFRTAKIAELFAGVEDNIAPGVYKIKSLLQDYIAYTQDREQDSGVYYERKA